LNFIENQNKTKDEINKGILSLLRTKKFKHLATHKLKEINKMPNELVKHYDKIFKDVLNRVPCVIDKDILI